MINTILFDLDGTLLPMDMERFLFEYFISLGKHLEDYIDPKQLPEIMIEATAIMISNKELETNEAVFMDVFTRMVGGDPMFFLEKFHEFYDTTFEEVKRATWKNQDIIKSIEVLKDKGYNLVVATNPVFPMKANLHRIRWAGFEPSDFGYITSLERNHFCKPNLEFYQEVLQQLDKFPDECLMVGNDIFEDGVARHLGIKTYLITDCLVASKEEEPVEPNYLGTYSDFLEFVKRLENII